MSLDILEYQQSKIDQLERLLYYLPFCETMGQKYKVQDEIKNIHFLIKNANDVYLLDMTVESKINYLKQYDYAEKMD
jgi:hypothetical protein